MAFTHDISHCHRYGRIQFLLTRSLCWRDQQHRSRENPGCKFHGRARCGKTGSSNVEPQLVEHFVQNMVGSTDWDHSRRKWCFGWIGQYANVGKTIKLGRRQQTLSLSASFHYTGVGNFIMLPCPARQHNNTIFAPQNQFRSYRLEWDARIKFYKRKNRGSLPGDLPTVKMKVCQMQAWSPHGPDHQRTFARNPVAKEAEVMVIWRCHKFPLPTEMASSTSPAMSAYSASCLYPLGDPTARG